MTAKPATFRLLFVCLMAISVALPIALISLAKLLLLLCAVAWLVFERRRDAQGPALQVLWTPRVVLLTLLAFAASLLWSTGSDIEPLGPLNKHAKLVLIPVLLFLLRSRREVLFALAAFALGQVFLLGSTGLLLLGIALPWARSNDAASAYAVFSSYLDQSMISATFAALCWQLRGLVPGRYGAPIAAALALLALACVFFVFRSRTGHLIGIAMVSLALMWELPRRLRAGALLVPLAVALLAVATVPAVRDRLQVAAQEVQAYAASGNVATSSGIRLNLWQRSLQALAQRPWIGSGVGSWVNEYSQLQDQHAPDSGIEFHSNPHQEFLLWSVELGLPGALLLAGLLAAICRDGARGDSATRRATLSLVLSLVLACLFNCALYDALIGDFYCVLIGLLLALAAHPATGGGPRMGASPA